jgi:hypothetical protein
LKIAHLALCVSTCLAGPVRAQSATPRSAAALSADAAAAPSPENARDLATKAFEPQLGSAPSAVAAGDYAGHKPAAFSPFRPALTADRMPEPPSPYGGSVGSMIGRKVGEEPQTLGRSAHKAAMCALGFAAGLVLGAFLGAAVGGAAAWTVKNPSLKPWRAALVVPAAVAGAIAGIFVAPFALAALFKDAKSYPKIPS